LRRRLVHHRPEPGVPAGRVTGFDLDDPSIELARINASETGTTGTRFVAIDGTELSSFGPFDVIFAFECVHDMAHPVEVLNAARQALTPGGVLIVMDEATANTFQPNGDRTERLLYGWSITLCLPDSLRGTARRNPSPAGRGICAAPRAGSTPPAWR
jgi:SAM-dependent methyltransferase